MTVETAEIVLPSGRKKERVVVRPGNAVAILPVEGEYCYLLRQYRFPIDETIWEVPAGTIDEGETPEETAYRELIEETGFAASKLLQKGMIYTTPGFTDEVIYLFEARGLAPSDEFAGDEDEVIEVCRVPVADLSRMIRDGEIVDAKSIALIHRCQE